MPWACWVLDHCTRRPSIHAAAAERTSSGTAATRWFTTSWRDDDLAPVEEVVGVAEGEVDHRVGAGGLVQHHLVGPRPPAGSTTAGSGS